MPLRSNLNTTVWAASLVLLAAITCRPTWVNAGERFQPVQAEELTMKSEAQAPGAAAVILYRQVDRDDNANTSHEDSYYRIKILTEEGRKYADVEIPFLRDVADIVNLKARTIRPDGSIINFEGKTFEKSLYKSRGVKYLAKTFTLPDIQVGCIVEYYFTYDFRQHYIYESHWILNEELFTRYAKFSLKAYDPNYTKVTVAWSWQGLPPGTEPPKSGPDRVIRLEARNIPAFQTEDFMPPENELKGRVDFVYSYDPPEPDKDKFWKQVGKRRYERLESFINKHNAMQQAVAQIISPNDPPEVELQKIYARVQQVRNTSYEERKTQQEEKRETPKENNNVEDIWKRGYGNGVELTWLYLALVRAAGFESYGLWVSDREHYFFSPSQLDPHRLDANAVLIKLNGKDIYCDPGAKFAPFGLLPWYETGTPALRLDKDGGALIQIPLPDSSLSRIEHRAELKLSDTGDLEGKLTMTLTGLEAMSRRSAQRNEDDAERRKNLEDHVKRYIPASIEVELTNHPNWTDRNVPVVAEFNLKVPGWASAAGHHVLVPVGLFGGTEKHLFDHAGRVHPIYMEFPFQKVDDVTIDMPPGWQVSNLPPPATQDGHIITYSSKVENKNGQLHLMRTLNVNFLLLQTQYYGALRNFYQQVRSGDEQQIVLQPGTTAASK
jgi:hypothetical protein